MNINFTTNKNSSILIDILKEREADYKPPTTLQEMVNNWKEIREEYEKRKQEMEEGGNANEDQLETEIQE